MHGDQPLWVDRDRNIITYRGLSTQLSPKQVSVFDAVFKAYPRVASIERIMAEMYGGDPGDWPTDKNAQVNISLANKRLINIGVQIVNIYGRGYELDMDT